MAHEPAADAGRGQPERATLERRSFLRGAGAALSAGLASAALVAAPASAEAESARAPGLGAQGSASPRRFALLQDTEEILTLHRRYGAALNEGRYEDIVDLFADESQVHFNGGIFAGKQRGVRRLYVEHFGARAAVGGAAELRGTQPALAPAPVHRLLLDAPEAREIIEVSADRRAATARFGGLMQVEVALAMTSSLADMARQQGQGAVRWWESGEFENTYLREAGVWKIQRLVYRATVSGQAQAQAMAVAGRSGQRPRGIAAFSQVYPQDPRGPDALIG